MPRLKHRVMVEITFDNPRTERAARNYVQGVLDGHFVLPKRYRLEVAKFVEHHSQEGLLKRLIEKREAK